MSIKNIEKHCKEKIVSEFNSDPIYFQRLDVELEDLNKLEKVGQNKADKLWNKFGKTTPVNTNKCGSLIVFLLGYSTVNPVAQDISLIQDEMYTDSVPDIDTDFDPRVRDWAKKHMVEVFGVKNVCSIGTYQAYKTRAVILDVARVLGENLAEVSAVTKRIEPLKGIEDDEGVEQKVDQMGFDDLCDHYPELKEYFEAHPEVRRHAEILRNQVKNMGTHAGGVIISDLDLSDRIPVLYDKPSSENRMVISAWAESGSVSELSSVGLVKFDLLGLNNLPVISDCVGLIEKTHGIKLSRKDIPISDRESIYVGSKKDLVGMFQFENPVTKPICNAVKMESLDDVAAITSLIRPGPMDAEIDGVRMPMEYARRKHGGEYLCPGFIKDALSETYGIIIYQEQVMKISRVLAGFTASEANKLRKACGKKIVSLMASIREKFISGSKQRIDAGEITLDEVKDIWGQIETFAGYGFNRSLIIGTKIEVCGVGSKEIQEIKAGENVWCFNECDIEQTEVVALHNHGMLQAFEVEFDDGSIEICSINHKFLTHFGQKPLHEILKLELGVISYEIKTGSISVRRVLHARCVGLRQMYDLEVRHPSHNFVLTSGIVTSNSHAVAYGAITTMEMWLKYHYRTEFLAALLNNTKQGKKKLGSTNIFADYLSYARRQDIVVKNPDVNTSKVGFTVENREICFALGHIKNVAKAAEYIEKYQPYTSMSDFYERVKMGVIEDPVEPEESVEVDGISDAEEELVEFEAKPVEVLKKKKSTGRRPTCRVMESLIAAGAFSSFGTKNEVLTEYYKLRKAKELPEDKTEEQWQELEAEILGVCLSKPVLYKQYLEKIAQEKWYLINEIPENKKKVMVFCKIEKIAQHISKAGNSMHLVTISDGLDSIVVFVFQGGWDTFKNNYNEGTIGAIPLSKFDDTESNTRFFDDRGKFEIIKKG